MALLTSPLTSAGLTARGSTINHQVTFMANTSVFSKVINYVKNYGKPDEGEKVIPMAVYVSLFIIAGLTILAFRFHVGFLCILLIGEYKEQYEYLKVLFKQK